MREWCFPQTVELSIIQGNKTCKLLGLGDHICAGCILGNYVQWDCMLIVQQSHFITTACTEPMWGDGTCLFSLKITVNTWHNWRTSVFLKQLLSCQGCYLWQGQQFCHNWKILQMVWKLDMKSGKWTKVGFPKHCTDLWKQLRKRWEYKIFEKRENLQDDVYPLTDRLAAFHPSDFQIFEFCNR